jgi:hypothetical protein
MASFTDGKPHIITEEMIKAPWSGDKNGKYFRCYFCGHRFKVGETFRWQYTNDISGACGNPLVCQTCDDGHDKTRKNWKVKCNKFNNDKWWWFRKINT